MANRFNRVQCAKATYSYATNGGRTGQTGLGVWIPATSVITRMLYSNSTPFVLTDRTKKISFHLGSAAVILSTGITCANPIMTSTATALPSTSTPYYNSTKKELKICFTGTATAGVCTLYVEYIMP